MPSAEIKGVGTKSSIINKLRENKQIKVLVHSRFQRLTAVKYYTLEDQILRIDIPSGVNGLSIIEFIILIMMYCILDLFIRRKSKQFVFLSRRNVQIYKK